MPVFDVNSSKHRLDQSFGAARVDGQLVGGKAVAACAKNGDEQKQAERIVRQQQGREHTLACEVRRN